jgi:hypothetical protein
VSNQDEAIITTTTIIIITTITTTTTIIIIIIITLSLFSHEERSDCVFICPSAGISIWLNP